MKKNQLKWIGMTLAGLSAAALSSSAMASWDLMRIAPEEHVIHGKLNNDMPWAFTGRFHFDYVAFSAPKGLHRHNVFASGFNMRRTYFGLMGGLGCDFGYRLGVEFAPSNIPKGYTRENTTTTQVAVGASLPTILQNDIDSAATGHYTARDSIAVKFLPTFIQYKGICDNVRIAFGNIAAPFGLENWGGTNTQNFMEGSMISRAFAEPYSTGVYADGHFGYFNVALAAYTHPGDYKQVPANVDPAATIASGVVDDNAPGLVAIDLVNNDVRARRVNDRFGVSGRITTAPCSGGACKYHVGLSAAYRSFASVDRGNGTELGNPLATAPHITIHPGLTSRATEWMVSSSPRPSRVTHFRAKNMLQMGIEAAMIWGPFHAQFEYVNRAYRRDESLWGATSINFDFKGWDLVAGYVITGESRPYDSCSGTIGNPVPCRPCCGAIEVVARYEVLELNRLDSTSPLTVQNPLAVGGIWSGKEENIVVGLNWFVNDYVRFQANYLVAKSKDQAVKLDGWKLNGYGIRAQVNF